MFEVALHNVEAVQLFLQLYAVPSEEERVTELERGEWRWVERPPRRSRFSELMDLLPRADGCAVGYSSDPLPDKFTVGIGTSITND